MMPHTKKTILLCAALLGLCKVASGKSDPECLKHVGGGYGDAICYGDLSTDLVAENHRIYTKIHAKIPTGDVHAKLLDSYMSNQDDAVKFCELQRDAGAGWETNPEGSMYPALYAGCAYDMRKAQNTFLLDLLKMSGW
jgi:hypothetical protein